MKKFFNSTAIALFAILFMGLMVACSDDDNNQSEYDYSDIPDYVEQPMKVTSEEVSESTLLVGDMSEKLASALPSRFTNIATGNGSDFKVAIVASNSLNENGQQIADLYHNGSIIIVTDPKHSELQNWCDKYTVGYTPLGDEDYALSLMAFAKCGNVYTLAELSDVSYDEMCAYLNGLVAWVNQELKNVGNHNSGHFAGDPDSNVADLSMLRGQHIQHEFPIYLNEVIRQALGSNPDMIKARSKATLNMTIYPLYVFQGQDGAGDYYVVNSTLTIHNGDMYKGYWKNKHLGVYTSLCGYIMNRVNVSYEMQNADGVIFPSAGVPVPNTSEVNESHTEGITWNLNTSLTAGVDMKGANVSRTYNAGVMINKSTTVTYPALRIRNNWSGAKVAFNYNTDNITTARGDMKWAKIIEPVADLIDANLTLNSDWIWYVPSTKDREDKSFKMQVDLNVRYHTMSMYAFAGTDGEYKDFDNGISNKDRKFTFDLQAPKRVPSGNLEINNSGSEYITNIKVWKASDGVSKEPIYTSEESVSPGNKTEAFVLPTDTYIVQLDKGPDSENLKTYQTKANFSIKLGETYTLNSDFDFVEVK